MGYEVYKLQNTSGFTDEKPDIVIQKGTPEWETAHKRWSNGKIPTNSPLWKRGVFACTRMLTGSTTACDCPTCTENGYPPCNRHIKISPTLIINVQYICESPTGNALMAVEMDNEIIPKIRNLFEPNNPVQTLKHILDLAEENTKGQDGYEMIAEWARNEISQKDGSGPDVDIKT